MFDILVRNISKLVRGDCFKVYKEKKNYGRKIKIHDVHKVDTCENIMNFMRNFNQMYTGEMQCYVVNRYGKRSVIIKWFNKEEEN